VDDQFPGGVEARFGWLGLPEFQVERPIQILYFTSPHNDISSHAAILSRRLSPLAFPPKCPIIFSTQGGRHELRPIPSPTPAAAEKADLENYHFLVNNFLADFPFDLLLFISRCRVQIDKWEMDI